MRRTILALAAVLTVAACGADHTWAPDDEVIAARYAHDGPKAITLYTVVNNRSGSGGHSALMINGSERVIFDPAGTWYHPSRPIRHDVHFGINDQAKAFYIDYHARETYRVVEQTVVVSPEVAEIALQRVLNYGAVPKALCASAVSNVLRSIPGFESIPPALGPNRIMNAFDQIPGVEKRVITDKDDDENHGILMIQADQTINND
ncbi:hypothetical protein E7811_09620 [Aliigemmobacter aestuarii]|uniref:Lipoprotein n=1 Tax=Aliigemmobacter aestuarii TaxID=1445661 RepID=A0A4S3MNN7_9RHOB|nr:hypothetical protein [Gemmobacter aestuarii]THD83533.1 hypothetical protein E7811_09620 [Gemmobacter aestuarii]